MKIQFLGAAKQVSGSMSLYDVGDLKILIDCGLTQTNDTKKDILENNKPFNFDPSDIDYCIITHAHIDHCGKIPFLVKSGFNGPILCTEPTLNICDISLKDCAFIWQRELERPLSKSKIKITEKDIPYTMEEAEYAMKSFRGYGYNKKIVLSDNVSLKFKHAGHILGAASLEFTIKQDNGYKNTIVVFTGDISGKDEFHPFIEPVEYINKADYIICESTYGNKKHIKTPVLETLSSTIKTTCIGNNKTLLIASFSVQRLQEIIWYLYETYQKHPEFNKIPIYIDTPMGINVSKQVYANADEFYNKEAKELFKNIGNLFEWDKLNYTSDYKDSMALANGTAKIIISSAGMMQAGRIINHIDSFLPSKGCTVILTGYCAIGTFGRKLLDAINNNHKTIQSITGKKLTIRANVIKIDGLSGHADKNNIIKYINNIKGLKKIILNHGEIDSIEELKNELKKSTNVDILIPNKNQTINLKQ